MKKKKYSSLRNNGIRVFAKGETISNNTWKTHINNNDLIIGPTGSGKTRGYVKPNLLNASESLIITDTKGSLVEEMGPYLEMKGYEVLRMDFTDSEKSIGYNPFDFVEYDSEKHKFNEKDIAVLAEVLYGENHTSKDPYWDEAGKGLLRSFIAAMFELDTPKEERTINKIAEFHNELAISMEPGGFDIQKRTSKYEFRMKLLLGRNPDSYAAKQFFLTMDKDVKTTSGCVRMMTGNQLTPFLTDDIKNILTKEEKIDIYQLANKKTALFLTISDMDRSQDKLANLFYAQALQMLCRYADKECEDNCLPVPVRFILDDFATNACIADFDKHISVIRSRGIAVSLILQSITQLDSMYGEAQAKTILNGCDTLLYLGGQDQHTAQYIGTRIDKTDYDVLSMPVDETWLIRRGEEPRLVKRYNLDEDSKYKKAERLARQRRAELKKAAEAAQVAEMTGTEDGMVMPPGFEESEEDIPF